MTLFLLVLCTVFGAVAGAWLASLSFDAEVRAMLDAEGGAE